MEELPTFKEFINEQKNKPMKNVVGIYHSRDLDGWCSGAILRRKCNEDGNKFIPVPWDYGNDIPKIQKDCDVYMMDISFPPEELEKLAESIDGDLIMIDHHKTAIDGFNTIKNVPENMKHKFDTKFAACELVWEYLYPDKDISKCVELLGLYDSFRGQSKKESWNEEVIPFQYYMRSVVNNLDSFNDEYLNDDKDFLNSSIENGKPIYKFLVNEAISYYNDNRIECELDGNKAVMFNKERFNPHTMNINYHKDGFDVALCFWYKGGKWNFSIYNENGKVDVSEIAKKFGGGGHTKASGFLIDDINDFFKKTK